MIQVLDKGYVELVEVWGSDERIIEAARMSTNKGFQGWGPLPNCKHCGAHIESENLETSNACIKSQHDFSGDEKLLRYLWKHRHLTPFEQCGLTFEIYAPIFVVREWMRHRTQCLAGDTKITCLSPNGTPYTRTIKEIYDLKYGGVVDDLTKRIKNGTSKTGTPVFRAQRLKATTRTRILPNCQHRLLRVFDENTRQFTSAPMLDIWKSGVKVLFTVKTSIGDIRASAQHPFLTKDGWKQLQYLQPDDLIITPGKVALFERPIPPVLRSGIGVWTSMMRGRLILPVDRCYECGELTEEQNLELDHVIPVSTDLSLALTESNLKPICRPCHRKKINDEQPERRGKTGLGIVWAVVQSVEKDDEDETYDISVAGPNHNYIANGMVVHNSYNEMSSRYTELPNDYYIPSIERLMAGMQAAGNKQASEGGFEEFDALCHQNTIKAAIQFSRDAYEILLKAGVAREIARMVLPVSQYSRFRASANLRNWLGFLDLRDADGVQWETREYAKTLNQIVGEEFPRTHALFSERLSQVP